jgi:hypothetical protein
LWKSRAALDVSLHHYCIFRFYVPVYFNHGSRAFQRFIHAGLLIINYSHKTRIKT